MARAGQHDKAIVKVIKEAEFPHMSYIDIAMKLDAPEGTISAACNRLARSGVLEKERGGRFGLAVPKQEEPMFPPMTFKQFEVLAVIAIQMDRFVHDAHRFISTSDNARSTITALNKAFGSGKLPAYDLEKMTERHGPLIDAWWHASNVAEQDRKDGLS